MITGDRGPDRSNAAAARLFGAGSLEAAFGKGFQTVTPWRIHCHRTPGEIM